MDRLSVGGQVYSYALDKAKYRFEWEDVANVSGDFVPEEAFRLIVIHKSTDEIETILYLAGEEFMKVRQEIEDRRCDVVHVNSEGIFRCGKCGTTDLALDVWGGGKVEVDGVPMVLCPYCIEDYE